MAHATQPESPATKIRVPPPRAGARRLVTPLLAPPLLALGLAAGLVLAGPAMAQPSSADIQWAQTVLKEKGFDAGRATGDLNAKTKAALSAFQTSVGLPPSGQLDAATVAKLQEGRRVSSTVQNLGAPDPNRPRASAPSGPESKPQAAPTTRVEAIGGMSGTQAIGSVVRDGPPLPAGIAGAPGHDGANPGGMEPAPTAAPRGAVTATPAPGADGAATAEDGSGSFSLTAPGWVRYGILGVIAAALLSIGVSWWRSGRRPERSRPLDDDELPVTARTTARREPSLGGTDTRTGPRRTPPLTARR